MEFWHVIEDHYLAKGWTRRDLERHIHKLMCDRYLRKGICDMTVRKDGKTWTADFYENGRSGRRIRKKGFATKSAAIRYEQDFSP